MSENKNSANAEEKNAGVGKQRALSIVGIVICVILLPIIIFNCIFIIQGLINQDEVPMLGGRAPLIVLTESMDPEIKAGDMIICKKINPEDVKLYDVISFFDPEGNGTSIVTHRVIEIIGSGDELSFRTRGDNNNAEDRMSVPAENLVGIWTGVRIPFVGRVALFMQSTAGLIICIGVPLAALVAYDVIRRKKNDKVKADDMEALKAELEALKSGKKQEAPNEEAPNETSSEAVNEENTEPQDWE